MLDSYQINKLELKFVMFMNVYHEYDIRIFKTLIFLIYNKTIIYTF